LFAGVLIGATAGVAIAGVAYGIWGYYGPTLGYDYKNRNTIVTSSGSPYGAWAYTEVCNQHSGNIPAGYMGAYARLYDEAGTLKAQRGWYYNDGPAWGISVVTLPYYVHGTYYSKGLTRAYNGSGYSTYATFRSPNQTY
jgi:hypothetical protein